MSSQAELSKLHHTILRQVVREGYAPTAAELAARLDITESAIKESLRDLAEYHGVVLHLGSSNVWVIHPFSLAPTNFLVHNHSGEWWSSCAWCALGAAALLKSDVTITTSLGAAGPQVDLHIRDGELVEKDYLVHFPIAMQHAWDNVIYTCSTMLLFEDEAQIDAWSKGHRIAKGDVQPVKKIWDFAQVWYSKHLDEDWSKWTVDEAQEIFARFGLRHPVWQLAASGQRF